MNKFIILLFTSAFAVLTACKKEDSAPAINLFATINSMQQVPTNSSTATGTFTGTYSSSTNQLKYTFTYQGFTPTESYLCLGTPGNNGRKVVLFSELTSPMTGTVTLPADQANQLLNNGMYVIMNSTAQPNGEIRGDIHR